MVLISLNLNLKEYYMKLKDKIILTIARFTRKHSFKGMQRILNFIFPPSNENKISTVIDDYDGDLKINIDTSSFLEWFLFFKRDYESDVIKLIKKILKPGSIAIDVGANIGIHTLVMSNKIGRNGKVLAVEPQPEILERLKSNISLNNIKNIQVLPIALSSKPGKVILYTHSDKYNNKAQSSFYKNHAENNLTRKIRVSVKTIDQIINDEKLKKVDFIKIDTEGNDFNVLKGAEKTICNHKPFIVFEYEKKCWNLSDSKLESAFQFLKGLNYFVYLILNKGQLLKLKNFNIDYANILASPYELQG